MARIIVDNEMKTTYVNDRGEVQDLGRTDYVGIARRHNMPYENARRLCLDELVSTFTLQKAADFDVIETPDGVFYRCPDIPFSM